MPVSESGSGTSSSWVSAEEGEEILEDQFNRCMKVTDLEQDNFSLALPCLAPGHSDFHRDFVSEGAHYREKWFDNGRYKNKLEFRAWTAISESVSIVHEHICGLEENSVLRQAAASLHLYNKGIKGYTIQTDTDLQSETIFLFKSVCFLLEALSGDSLVHCIQGTDLMTSHLEMLLPPSNRQLLRRSKSGRKKTLVETVRDDVMVLGNKPRVCLIDMPRELETFPLAAVETKSPLKRITPIGHEDDDISGFARFLRQGFEGENLDEYTANILRTSASAITQAIHSVSGCAALHNHNKLILFWLEQKEKNRKVIVRVSKVFRCDSEKGLVAALVAFFAFALENCSSKSPTMVLKHVFGLASFIGGTILLDDTGSIFDKRGASRNVSNAQDLTLESQDAAESRDSRGLAVDLPELRNAQYAANDPRTEHWAARFLDSYLHEKDPERQFRKVLIYEAKGQGFAKRFFRGFFIISNYWWENITIEDAQERLAQWESNALVTKYYLKSSGVLGIGDCGVVKPAFSDSGPVAVKFWSEHSRAQYPHLCKEMYNYVMMSSLFPDVMGVAVPQLVAVGTDPWVGPVLVTKLVGKQVGWGNNGTITVGQRALNAEDKKILGVAALKSLRRIHHCQLLHGDIRLENLRALKTDTTWQAWWVDLGEAHRPQSRIVEQFGQEMISCQELFID